MEIIGDTNDPLLSMLKDETLSIIESMVSLRPDAKLAITNEDFTLYRPVSVISTLEVQIRHFRTLMIEVSVIDYYAFYTTERHAVNDPKVLDWFRAMIRAIVEYSIGESVSPSTERLRDILENISQKIRNPSHPGQNS